MNMEDFYGRTKGRIKDDTDVGGGITGSQMAVVTVYTMRKADNYSGGIWEMEKPHLC